MGTKYTVIVETQMWIFYIVAAYLLVLVLEGKVQSLSWEISNNVGQVTAPVWSKTLFLWNADKAINHTLVLLIGGDLFRDVLNLQKQFHTLDGCDGSLWDSCGDTSGSEVLDESNSIKILAHFAINNNAKYPKFYIEFSNFSSISFFFFIHSFLSVAVYEVSFMIMIVIMIIAVLLFSCDFLCFDYFTWSTFHFYTIVIFTNKFDSHHNQ